MMTLVHRGMDSKTEQFQFKHVCFCKIMKDTSITHNINTFYILEVDGSFRGNLGEVFVRCNNVGHDPIWIDFEEMKICC